LSTKPHEELLWFGRKYLIFLFYVTVIITLSIFVSWWFILGIVLPAFKLPVLLKRARVLKILATEYQYEFSATAPQAHTLIRMERETRPQELSDEELATLFMAEMVSTLWPNDDGAHENDIRGFAKCVRDNATRLAIQGSISPTICAQLEEILQQRIGRQA
jgi:hypothetical protein